MEEEGRSNGRPGRRLAPALLALAVGSALQGCGLYGDLMRLGGSFPLGTNGAAWSPAFSTPTGGALGVQIIQRF